MSVLLASIWLTVSLPTPTSCQTISGEAKRPGISDISKPSGEVASGTLNLVLANRNGFVIVTDSRMSSDNAFHCHDETSSPSCDNQLQHKTTFYCDDSQKLFRTGHGSAAAIAGFAVGHDYPSPLRLQIADIMRRKFGPSGMTGDTAFGEVNLPNRPDTRQVGDWAELVLQPALTELM